MADTSRQQRASIPPQILATIEEKLEGEKVVLEAFLKAAARAPVDDDAWAKLHGAAVRDARTAELAFAYEAILQDKRLKALPPPSHADFLLHAAQFFGDVFGDDQGASSYLERALAIVPGHPEVFEKLESILVARGDLRELAERYVELGQHRPTRAEQAQAYRRASELLGDLDGAEDRLVEVLQFLLRVEPSDEAARFQLAATLSKRARPRDVVRVFEQGLTVTDPAPSPESALRMRSALVEMYADELHELERATPHVEALLALDPDNAKGRAVAEQLLESKGVAARAAAALAAAHAASGHPEEVARYLAIELEHTRGTRRRDVLLKLGVLRQDQLGDPAGAYEALEQALMLDPTDDETRVRFVRLAIELGRQLDAVRTLGKVSTTAKDAPVRARLSADTGELLLSGGDKKRARTVFGSVLAMPEAPDDAVLAAAHALHPLLEEEGDMQSLVDVLERITTLEPDPARARAANERVAELAMGPLADRPRAIAAWKRLLETTSRARALEALESLYRESSSDADLAFILEERAKDAPEPEARALLLSAADASKKSDPARAINAYQSILVRFGPDRDVHARLAPLLEGAGRFQELALLLEQEANLASEAERGGLYSRAGLVRLTRLREVAQAIELLRKGLAFEPDNASARTALEKLLAAGDHRLAAATALEPFYRRGSDTGGLLRVLEVKASQAATADERLAALDEAVRVAESDAAHGAHALDFAGRGLVEAAQSSLPFESWIDRVLLLSRDGDAKRRAAIFVRALADRPVEDSAHLLLARHTGDALAATGDVQGALAVFRRALAFDPSSRDLITRVDGLLRDQGSPRERVALYSAALEREADPAQRRRMLHQIGATLRHELRELDEAAEVYRQILALEADDRDAHAALLELYTELGAFTDLIELLEKKLVRASGADALRLRAELAALASEHGEPERASAHSVALLEQVGIGAAELEVVERAATRIEDWDLLSAALEKRAALAGEPKDAVIALEQLGVTRKLRQDDDEEAVAAFRRGAKLAEESGDAESARRLYERIRKIEPTDLDATSRLAELLEARQKWNALPDLFAVLIDAEASPREQAILLLRLAGVLSDHLGDPSGAAAAAGRAFRAAPGFAKALDTYERMSVLAGETAAFTHAIDEVSAASADPDVTIDLLLSKTRVLSRDPQRHDEAAVVYRSLLTRDSRDEARRELARAGFERLLETAEPNAARRADRRWLLEYQSEHTTGAERVEALLAWARAEESAFGDIERALGVYRSVLESDPDRSEAAAAVTRLTLATGDVSGAIASLFTQRERAEGAARRGIDLEIATILVDRGERLDEALGCLEALLADAPDDGDAILLTTRLLRGEESAARAMALLEDARKRTADSPAKQKILGALLEAPREATREATRRAWFEELADLQRASGKKEAALVSLLRAVEESPGELKLWDACEALARELKDPGGVADVYVRILNAPAASTELMEIAQRAVAFHEEWFDDPTRAVGILNRVLELEPEADWAFDRLKLLYDSREQWTDLFTLYDHAIAKADLRRKLDLLDEAAQTAKDFANHSERAIGYLEQLHALKPSARVTSAIERLYERHGRHRELIDLLVSQLGTLGPREGRDARVRIAGLALHSLGSAAEALAILEEVLAPDPKESPTLSSLGDAASKDRARVVELLERIVELAPRTAETRASMLPPPPVTDPAPASAAESRSAPSLPPPRARIKRMAVRQRAAAILRSHYTDIGNEAALAAMLEVELEVVQSVKERIRRHGQLALVYQRLGRPEAALEHFVALVMLEPDVPEHRDELARLAESVGRFDRLAEVLAAAADDCTDEALRVELLMQAGTVHEDQLGDSARSIELYLRVLGLEAAEPTTQLGAAQRVEPLLRAASRGRERLDVLERLSALTAAPVERSWALGEAAVLAAELGETERAIAAWERRLDGNEADREALDGLVALLEREERWDALAKALRRRANAAEGSGERRADRVRIARLQSDRLDDPDRAIEEWRAIERDFGPSDDSTHALVRLLRATEQWEKLSALLDVAAERATTPPLRAALLRELGEVRAVQLQDSAAAIVAYEAALLSNPGEERATAGLLLIADDPAHRAEAVRVLLAAYAATDDWLRALELTEHRLAAAGDAASRVKILAESAQLAEQRAGDLHAALEYVRRAFELAPDDADLEKHLFRLTEVTDEWRAYVETHRRILEALDETEPRRPDLLAALRVRLGEALEKHLEDARGALNAYLRAATDAPSNLEACLSAVRLAGLGHRWEAAVKVILQHAAATEATSEPLLSTVEAVATAPAAWDGITSAFGAALAERTDLPPNLLREFESRVGAWHRDRRGDPDAAEAAFARALSFDSMNAELLGSLAQIQRRAKGRPLVESLLRLSQATGGDLDLLREAAEIATSAVADRALAKSILERLTKLATERWLGSEPEGRVSSGGVPAPDYLKWALDELIRIHNEEGDPEKIVELLVETSKLPFESETRRAMRHRAARVAVERIGEVDRAIKLYEELYDEDTSDVDAGQSLVELLGAQGKRDELLALRRRQIGLARSSDARIDLRLLAARLELGLGRVDEATATLHENLKDEPRHGETVAELVGILEGTSRGEELASLLADQAALAEAESDADSARLLWAQAARVAEERLGDLDAAILYHTRVVALAPEATSLEALSRLSAERGDHAAEAEHLGQQLECTLASERTPIILRLATALERSGRAAAAREALERAIVEDPTRRLVRERLADVYRRASDTLSLARLLAEGAPHATTTAERSALLREAASLYRSPGTQPDAAIPLLREASDLDPENRSLRLSLADTLGEAGRVEDARSLLRVLIDDFGGRRPKERAPVHLHLAQLDLLTGDRPHALAELEAANRIDPANPEILLALAELARDDGELDRAERSYRALLGVVRRTSESAAGATITKSEVLLELSEIARRQGEGERASEILESALEAAAESELEAARLESALRARGLTEILARALEARLLHESDSGRRARALFDLADALATLGRDEEAYAAALRGLELDPSSEASHQSLLDLARRTGGTGRYVEMLTRLATRAEESGDAERAHDLYIRLAVTAEDDQGDFDRAAELLERARALRESGAVLEALERVHERRGDGDAREATLLRWIELERTTGAAPSRVAGALSRLAALRFAAAESAPDACALVIEAATLDPEPSRLVALSSLLAQAADRHPKVEAVLSLYEDIARRSGDSAVLLDALRRRALDAGGGDALREAVVLADRLGERAVVEHLLRGYAELVRGGSADDAYAAWALTSLAAVLEEAGELRDALGLRSEAADHSEGADARKLRFEVARAAHETLGDLELAANTYRRLFDEDPSDRAAWEPLLEILRKGEDKRARVALLGEVTPLVDDGRQRSALRLERARLLFDLDPQSEDGVAELFAVLDDDPESDEAARLLSALLRSQGRTAELAELVARQLDAAKDKADAPRVVDLSLELATLLEGTEPASAIDVVRGGLDWDKESRVLLQRLFTLLENGGDAGERAEVMERLLALATGAEAEDLALRLIALREESWDEEGTERAASLGYKAHPESSALRDRLVTLYRDRKDHQKLAELHVLDASARTRADERVAVLGEAARLYREELAMPEKAAQLLKEARTLAPHDEGVFRDYVAALIDAGNFQSAAAEVTAAAAHLPENDPRRAALFAQRATLRANLGDQGGALYDLERAYATDPAAYLDQLCTQLDRLADEALAASDAPKAVTMMLRTVSIYGKAGRSAEARERLSSLLERQPGNKDALRTLAELEERDGRWTEAASAYLELAGAEEVPETLAALALRAAAATEQAGEPARARPALERAWAMNPTHEPIMDRLRAVYEAEGAIGELANLGFVRAQAAAAPEERFAGLVRSASLLVQHGIDLELAGRALTEAHQMKPNDVECAALLSDAYAALGEREQSLAILHATLTLHKGRRARELSLLHHRVARLEHDGGNLRSAMMWLSSAIDLDAQNGLAAAELANLSLEQGDLDLATKALRAVTMLKSPGPLPRAVAYQRLGEIAHHQGDTRKAVLLLKRAVDDDPSLETARQLLSELQAPH
jgi:tetratricopeptide (TPR) repeat protein